MTSPRHSSRSVCVVGPQSTGKTTLIDALADRFQGNIPVIKEVARHVMQEKGYTREDVDSPNRERRFALQRDIFTAQIEMENSFLVSGRTSSFLSDRSAIDPIVYLTHYAGPDESLRITSTVEWQKARRRYADTQNFLIVLLSPVPEFLVDDNTRYMSKSLEDWHSLTNSFREFLDAQRIPFIEIGENCIDLKERVTLVLNQPTLQEWKDCESGIEGHD
jgi:nicotinamide riboside kinase